MPLKIFIFLLLANLAQAQLTVSEILLKSINVHDPKQRWQKLQAEFKMNIVREKVADRFFTVRLDLPKKAFSYEIKNDSLHYFQGFRGEKHEVMLNGKTELTASEIKKYDLAQTRTQYMREVYEYLLLLPMRLQNDLKFLQTDYSEENFNQKSCYKLTIQYEPVNENETWYFFIDKHTFVLQGYQFYLKDKSTNGEYIFLEDYITFKGILIPKIKRWYWNKDNSFFRTDKILKIR